MPNPRLGLLASWLIAAISWTFPCERQVKECRASEGTVPTECGVIHVRGRNEVPVRGSNGIKQANYCLSCGPDSCCAECPPAEPSLRVACLKKPVALPGIWFPERVASDPGIGSAAACGIRETRFWGWFHPANPFVAAPAVACQALFIPWSSSHVALHWLRDIPQSHPARGAMPRVSSVDGRYCHDGS